MDKDPRQDYEIQAVHTWVFHPGKSVGVYEGSISISGPPQEPVFPPLNLQNSGSFNLPRRLGRLGGRKRESESLQQVFGVKKSPKKNIRSFQSGSPVLESWDGSKFKRFRVFSTSQDTSPIHLLRVWQSSPSSPSPGTPGTWTVRTGDTQDACCIHEIIIIFVLFVMSYLLDSTRSPRRTCGLHFAHIAFNQHHKHVAATRPCQMLESPWAISQKRLQKDMVHKEKRDV